MKQSSKIAFCGMMAALSVVVMFLTGVVPVASIALPAVAGCFLIPVVVEAGVSWGFGVYAVCALLSFLLAGDREALLFYLFFFGYYPVLYAPLGKIQKKWLRITVKLLVFNAAMAAQVLASVFILGIPLETAGVLGIYAPIILWVLLNVVFVVYDRALDGLILLYINRFHGMIRRLFQKK